MLNSVRISEKIYFLMFWKTCGGTPW